MKLCITIISFNHRELLRRCVQAALASIETARVSASIWVLDNASTDGSVEMVRAAFPAVNLLAESRGRGFAANQNLLLAACQDCADYVLVLNDDALLASDTLLEMLSIADLDPAIGALGPRLCFQSGDFQSAGERLPSLGYHILRHLGIGRLVPPMLRYQVSGRDATNSGGAVVRQSGYVVGACMLIRAQALAAVGGFDERFKMYSEDADWCLRAGRQGWKICVAPWLPVVHYRNQSWGVFSAVERERSMFRYLRKHKANPTGIAVLKLIVVASSVWHLWALRLGSRLRRRGPLNAVAQPDVVWRQVMRIAWTE